MYCFNCGKQLPDEARFCAYCGTDLAQLNNDTNVKVNTEINNVPFQESTKQEREAVLANAREQYRFGIGAFERGQYQKAQTYFMNALEGGLREAAFTLAETYYRNDSFSWFADENKINYINADGKEDYTYLSKDNYVVYYLLRAAIDGNRRAILELCAWITVNCGESAIRDLIRYGLLDDIKKGFVIGGSSFNVEKEDFINLLGEKCTRATIEGLEDWAYANLIESAQAGDGVAQYYIGVYYAKKYDTSCSSEHQSKAKYWLAQAEGKVNTPNVYAINKYLNKFIAFGDCPANDFFV